MNISGSRFIITGGGSGIGLAVAQLAVKRGASVVLLGRTEAKLAAVVAEIGDAASYRVMDVTDAAAVTEAFDAIGAFNHLVTAAAGIVTGPFADLPENAFRAFFEVKFWGQFRAIRAAQLHLARTGSITLLSGYLFRKPTPGFSAFSAVNGAIEALVKVLALELAPLRINALAPGQIDTLRDIIGSEANEARKRACATLPIGRIGTPEEVAHAALFLAGNSYTTGSVLDVDGGQQ